jgi:hypothetical protein
MPPPVRVKAPMCVHTTVMRQISPDKSQRLVVHLFNDLNTTAFHAIPHDDVPLREETVPIHDILLRFRPDYPVDRVHLQPGGQVLSVQSTPEGHAVRVPRLDVHAMLIAELEDRNAG